MITSRYLIHQSCAKSSKFNEYAFWPQEFKSVKNCLQYILFRFRNIAFSYFQFFFTFYDFTVIWWTIFANCLQCIATVRPPWTQNRWNFCDIFYRFWNRNYSTLEFFLQCALLCITNLGRKKMFALKI